MKVRTFSAMSSYYRGVGVREGEKEGGKKRERANVRDRETARERGEGVENGA